MRITESKLREVIRSVIVNEKNSINEEVESNSLDDIKREYSDKMHKVYSELGDCESVGELSDAVRKMLNINGSFVSNLIHELKKR